MPALESVEESEANLQANESEKPTPAPVIGIIYPPPEVRSILNLKTFANVCKLFTKRIILSFLLLNFFFPFLKQFP